MSRLGLRRLDPRSSNSRLRVAQRLVRSWTRWSLRMNSWRVARARRRTILLQQATDRSLVREKELQQLESLLQNRLSELTASRSFRTEPRQVLIPPQGPPTPHLLAPTGPPVVERAPSSPTITSSALDEIAQMIGLPPRQSSPPSSES